MSVARYFAAITAGVFVCLCGSAAGKAARVKLDSKLGQSAFVSGDTKKIYLRISLEGMHLPNSENRTPVNVGLVIDRSGSMSGRKIDQAKEAAVMAIDRLSSSDYAAVVAYNHDVEVIVPAMRVGGNTEMAGDIRRLRSGGRTALYAGTQQGIREVRRFLADHRVNRVILLSDGLANVGPSSPEHLAELGRDAVRDGISITTIGLGLGYNEDLMAKLAYNSDGNHAFVENADDLVKIFNDEFGDVLSVVAQEITITIECRNGFRPSRVLGRKAQIDGNLIKLRMNQLYGSQEKYVVVELDVPKGGAVGEVNIADVKVQYREMGKVQREEVHTAIKGQFTSSHDKANATVDKQVMTSVATQIANEVSENAVTLRDKGKIKEARKLLEQNADYLRSAAEKYDSDNLRALGRKNLDDAAAVASQAGWKKARKAMRAQQHKSKMQQSY